MQIHFASKWNDERALPGKLHGLALLTKEELSRLEFHFTGVTENQIKSILRL